MTTVGVMSLKAVLAQMAQTPHSVPRCVRTVSLTCRRTRSQPRGNASSVSGMDRNASTKELNRFWVKRPRNSLSVVTQLLGHVLGDAADPGVQLEGRGEEGPGGAHPLAEERNGRETPQRAQSRGFVAQQRQTSRARRQGGSQGFDDACGEVGARAWVRGGAGRYVRQ